jgi:antirestriction protein ArdC
MTYKKAAELGAQVRKGAKSEYAFYVGAVTRTEERNGEETERTIPFLKAYNVFNVDEIDGLPDQYRAIVAPTILDDTARIARCDEWISNIGANISHGGGRAFFQPSTDSIRLPEFSAFETAPRYYSVAFHELTHWAGHSTRLDRTKGKVFGDPAYAFEELVAELGASYLCADLGVDSEPREDHASYIASWVAALKSDNRNIFRAASYAEKSAAFLHGRQPSAAADAEPELLAMAA